MRKLEVTYTDIAQITKKSMDATRGDATRGDREGFNIEDLDSVIKYCAKWAPLAFKVQLFEAMCAPSGGETKRRK